jgi:hypothetical protein
MVTAPVIAGVVTALPFESWMATVTRRVAAPSAAFGDALPAIASLFAAPLRTVVSVAEPVLTPVVAADAVHEHVPGVLVEVMVKNADPADTIVGPPEPPPLKVQELEPVSRETVIDVELSLDTIVPAASVTSTSRTDFELPSALMEPR